MLLVGQSQAPPSGNVPIPLNVSGEDQVKDGGLVIHNSSSFGNPVNPNALLIPYGNIGIGTTSSGYKLDVNGALRIQPGFAPTAANGVNSINNSIKI